MPEYLVTFGVSGDFARFQGTLTLRRGERVIVRGGRGLELGTVLRPAGDRLAGMLPEGNPGELVRRATADDEALAVRLRERGQRIFVDARRLARELNLALEVLDVEVPLDEQFAIVQVLGSPDQALVEALAEQHDIAVALHNLALPAAEAATGCGKPDCGEGHGGCTSCSSSSGGGCATGCGTPQMTRDVQEYFSGLRRKMEGVPARTPLL